MCNILSGKLLGAKQFKNLFKLSKVLTKKSLIVGVIMGGLGGLFYFPIGKLFSYFILETILLGRALNINPYDQPSVELIKKETKKILI